MTVENQVHTVSIVSEGQPGFMVSNTPFGGIVLQIGMKSGFMEAEVSREDVEELAKALPGLLDYKHDKIFDKQG